MLTVPTSLSLIFYDHRALVHSSVRCAKTTTAAVVVSVALESAKQPAIVDYRWNKLPRIHVPGGGLGFDEIEKGVGCVCVCVCACGYACGCRYS
jgi:hypothetical protein